MIRWGFVAVTCLASALVVGCVAGVQAPRGTTGSSSAIPTPSVTPSNIGPPFTQSGGPGIGIGRSQLRSLASELARIENPPSLPATAVAGAADAAYAGHRKHPQGIWVHYATGIFLSIQREAFSISRAEAETKSPQLRHPDGSSVLAVEIIGGRKTAVTTGGAIFGQNGRRYDTRDGLNWSQDGWHYFMQGNGPKPASLDLMKRVAASIP